jgi:hypothetical protein
VTHLQAAVDLAAGAADHLAKPWDNQRPGRPVRNLVGRPGQPRLGQPAPTERFYAASWSLRPAAWCSPTRPPNA